MAKKPVKPHQTLKIPKIILFTGKFLSFISTNLVVKFAARLFTTPIKHTIPKRERDMDAKSLQQTIAVPGINKNIVVYHFGESPKKILLVHGWSGRGTQLFKFAENLIKSGYSTVSFDAPAHGKSSGKTTLMPEFIESILEIEKQFGPFEAAVGHSLGGMALLNAVRKDLKLKRLVTIGSGNIIKDIFDDFVARLELRPNISDLMKEHFEAKFNAVMDSFSSYQSAKVIAIPVLVIHDEQDDEVPVECAHQIYENLHGGELMITEKLGHRKILGDEKVIAKVLHFIQH